MSYIKPEEIYNATDNGLDIILQYYPDARECLKRPGHKFKIRNSEKTASATLRQVDGGVWVVTDFGGDGKPRNAIEIVRLEEGLNWYDAVNYIAERFAVPVQVQAKELLRPLIDSREATEEEDEGKWYFEFNEEVSERELEGFFSEQVRNEKNTEALRKVCKNFQFFSLKSYRIIKNRKATIIQSTEHYPIFVWVVKHNNKEIHKIYQPKSLDKGKRFMYYGGRPDDFVFGLVNCVKRHDALNKDDEKYENLDEEDQMEARKEIKIPEIILCTGGSDAMNAAALDYSVVWLNSESAKLTAEMFNSINRLTNRFCILYDLDATGKLQAHDINMIYLDLCQIKLPNWLLERKDWRGNACKDLRDYFRFKGSKDFKKLVDTALPYRFWDQMPQYDKKGNFKSMGYECNNEHLYNFLSGNGFYQMRTMGERDIYIKITGNSVKEIPAKDIKKFVIAFLQERGFEVKLRNTFYNTTRMNATSFENLKFIELDFTNNGKDYQLMFFENATWKITAKEILEYKPGEIAAYVWEDEVIKHRVKLQDKHFEITEDDGEYKIEILEKENIFLQFLNNTSKVYWTIEEYGKHPNGYLVDRKELTKEEISEQHQHMVNRIFSLGYAIHQYKDDSKSWALWFQEFKAIEDSVSDGGSGKSICAKFPTYFMSKAQMLGARESRFTENKHLLENLNEYTKYLVLNDCNEYLNFDYFYPMITDGYQINPKNTKSFILGYEHFPKMAFTSNYSPRNNDPSTMRRILFGLFSDYYHHGPSDSHPEARTPKDDFKMNLFRDFDEKQWNYSLNVGAQFVQFFLGCKNKIDPPMANANKRSLLTDMGMPFKNWADVYFSVDGDKLDAELVKKDIAELCIKQCNPKWTAQKFTKGLKAWCKFYGYTLNPPEMCNDGKRIIKNASGETWEVIYIQTKQLETIDKPNDELINDAF